ncbi:MAG TPA: flagellar protein FlaG [Armatimonadota bacterium]|nr:flagellar protein FlaG [Armatimonadota bacterium]HOS43059.1 flagellar protein FlaG [Armatimonadota bacterium]
MAGSMQFDIAGVPPMRRVTHAPSTAPATTGTPAGRWEEAAGAPHASQPVTLEQDHLVASYDYREDLHMVIITLRSQDTGEVIQQLPPEQILHLLQGVMERLGAVVDQRG